MGKYALIPGINVQYPWSEYIVSGEKTIETRRYPIPEKHIQRDLALIETPGKAAAFKARVIAIVRFGRSFQYKSESEFVRDRRFHLVGSDDQAYSWNPGVEKWGWPIESVVLIESPIDAPVPRGIVFASQCRVPRELMQDSK